MNITIKRILCPTDFSKSADHALDYALAIAARHHASVELLNVAEISAYAEEAVNDRGQTYDEILEDRLRAIIASKATTGVEITARVLEGTDYVEIVQRASAWPADLIVLGTHGLTGLKHFLIGSVAERVVRTAACPVCTVRHPDHAVDRGENTQRSLPDEG